jgi:hypothetical protein
MTAIDWVAKTRGLQKLQVTSCESIILFIRQSIQSVLPNEVAPIDVHVVQVTVLDIQFILQYDNSHNTEKIFFYAKLFERSKPSTLLKEYNKPVNVVFFSVWKTEKLN